MPVDDWQKRALVLLNKEVAGLQELQELGPGSLGNGLLAAYALQGPKQVADWMGLIPETVVALANRITDYRHIF